MKIFAGLLSLLATACTFFPRPAPSPVKMQTHEPPGDPDQLVVLLPGRHSLPSEFEREGFVGILRSSRPHARIVAPDLHIGYYRNRQMAERLHRDVIIPAKQAGVRQITLVGISMGGLGAMLYELEHPGQVDEVILLSPFLGDESVITDIGQQGGLAALKPEGKDPDRFSRKLWLGLRDRWLPRKDRPELHLACGESDRLASSTRLASAELRPAGTVWLPGDHDWQTWNALIQQVEDR
ncbi:alpha/beta fold hydrolase [Haloferula sp. A504]|uniref:alpha/beta fold hydrolase n=1 Tax=Haloferula sp. A504 TaxID=3373601 RepID=UPI0031BDF668|nr:alpha/beta hydrolase [Verrucomicrobiaceae bacterium E54]